MSDPERRVNLCTTCRLDFASVAAFDRHRVGRHLYSYSEGLRLDPAREDGRRCLHQTEMVEHGFIKDTRGRWVDPKSMRNRPREGGYPAATAPEGSPATPTTSGDHDGVGTTR